MGVKQPSEFYDQAFTEERYTCGYQDSPYYPLYNELSGCYDFSHRVVIDVGCGTGQLGQLLMDRFSLGHYFGVDFSQQAITVARSRGLNCVVLDAELLLPHVAGAIYLLVEVLEHLDDWKVLGNIPSGAELLITLPTFDSAGHVRYFSDENEITERYESQIRITSIKRFEEFFIVKGVRC